MSSPVTPIELCLESLDQLEDDHPYVRCVAISGAEPGLGLSAVGEITWCDADPAAVNLWVSADNQLIVTRGSNSDAVRLTRGERFLDLPLEKPVVILDQDFLSVNGHTFRVHVHGIAASVEPPTKLALRRVQSMIAGAAVAAVSMAGCHTSTPDIGVASASPSATASALYASGGSTASITLPSTGGITAIIVNTSGQDGTGGSTNKLRATRAVRHIEVRNHPPKPQRPSDP